MFFLARSTWLVVISLRRAGDTGSFRDLRTVVYAVYSRYAMPCLYCICAFWSDGRNRLHRRRHNGCRRFETAVCVVHSVLSSKIFATLGFDAAVQIYESHHLKSQSNKAKKFG